MAANSGADRLNLRWTIGDVAAPGFEALRLSLHGARQLFGDGPAYHVFVNTIPLDEARRRVGEVPSCIEWHQVEPDLPAVLRPFLDEAMSEGTSWKFVPLQIDTDTAELAFDNDVILWGLPQAVRQWLDGGMRQRLIAEDVAIGHRQFTHLAGDEPRNSGIRGTPAGFDLGQAIAAVLEEQPVRLESELDEQGLQIAAMLRDSEPLVVRTGDVSICSPFPPHQPDTGRYGAHFVGLNAHGYDWDFHGRPALEVRREHWAKLRPDLYERLGLFLPDSRERAPVAASC